MRPADKCSSMAAMIIPTALCKCQNLQGHCYEPAKRMDELTEIHANCDSHIYASPVHVCLPRDKEQGHHTTNTDSKHLHISRRLVNLNRRGKTGDTDLPVQPVRTCSLTPEMNLNFLVAGAVASAWRAMASLASCSFCCSSVNCTQHHHPSVSLALRRLKSPNH